VKKHIIKLKVSPWMMIKCPNGHIAPSPPNLFEEKRKYATRKEGM
jgi:hypothetical protein